MATKKVKKQPVEQPELPDNFIEQLFGRPTAEQKRERLTAEATRYRSAARNARAISKQLRKLGVRIHNDLPAAPGVEYHGIVVDSSGITLRRAAKVWDSEAAGYEKAAADVKDDPQPKQVLMAGQAPGTRTDPSAN
jgi:hypothetical protein